MATAYQEAAVCYRKTDTNAAVRCYKQTSEVRSRQHRLRRQVLAFPRRALSSRTRPGHGLGARRHLRARALTHMLGSSPTPPSPTAPTQIHIELGRFTSAAKVQKEIGELYEAEGDTAAALKAYEEAAEYYNAEESKSQANQILLKVASLAADASNYTRAIEIYEQVWRSPRKMALMALMAPCTRSSRSPPSSRTCLRL